MNTSPPLNSKHEPMGSVRALCLLALLLLAVPGLAQTTILTEGFEGSFPADNGWSVGDANASGTPAYWDDVNSSFGGEGTHGGSWKGYCAGVGYAGTTTSPFYTNYMSAYMSKTIALAGYSSATLTFWYKMPSIESCCDSAKVYMDSTVIWSSASVTSSWTQVTLSLNSYVGASHIQI